MRVAWCFPGKVRSSSGWARSSRERFGPRARGLRARRRGARRLDQRAVLRRSRSRAHAHAQHAARDRDDQHRRARRAARRVCRCSRCRSAPRVTRSVSTARSSRPARSSSRTPCASFACAAKRCKRPCPPVPARWPRSWVSRPRRWPRSATRQRQGEVVSPANFNAPGQIVIAGHAAAVARAGELAGRARGKAIPLKVSAPFHCSLMAPAAAKLAARLETIDRASALAFPVIANVDARPNRDAARVKELLVQQVDHPVRWEETVRADGRRRRDARPRNRPGQSAGRARAAHRQRDRSPPRRHARGRRSSGEALRMTRSYFASRWILMLLIFGGVFGRSPITSTEAILCTISSGLHSPKIV